MKGLGERLAVGGFIAEQVEFRFNALAGDVKASRISTRQRVATADGPADCSMGPLRFRS